jgi:hypothetical protein
MAVEKSVTVWDGVFIRFEKAGKAATDAAAGLVQIWKGKLGWDPGFRMKYKNEFVPVEPEEPPEEPVVEPDPPAPAPPADPEV